VTTNPLQPEPSVRKAILLSFVFVMYSYTTGGPFGLDNPFAQIPFPDAPLNLYNGRPWFLPLAGAWYKLLDWIS
jgi:hypothetical protein